MLYYTFLKISLEPDDGLMKNRVRTNIQDVYRSSVALPGPCFYGLATGIMAACLFDAFASLILIGRGAREINPLMAVLIAIDPALFTLIKILLTGVCLTVLGRFTHRRLFGLIHIRHILYTILTGYALLMVYESVLLSLF